MKIPEQIKAARKGAGKTQTQLAIEVGIPRPVLSDYERGVRPPSIEHLSRLADMLGCNFTIDRDSSKAYHPAHKNLKNAKAAAAALLGQAIILASKEAGGTYCLQDKFGRRYICRLRNRPD